MKKFGVQEEWPNLYRQCILKQDLKLKSTAVLAKKNYKKVGAHQGSVLSPLLFVIVMKGLSREFRYGCPWELLHGNNLTIVDEDLNVLIKLTIWKDKLAAKYSKVNMEKQKNCIAQIWKEVM